MKKMRLLFALLLILGGISILIIIIPGTVNWARAAEGDGGTDQHIRLSECQTDGEGFDWNEIHGFAILEDDEVIDEEFNVSISEDVKYYSSEDKYKPVGHIFGELHEIHCDDDPEPSITITQNDFDAYKDDKINLTVYILVEYWREGSGEDELRQAYREVLVQRPNNAPVAMAMITDSDEYENGNWTGWKNASDPKDLNEDGELSYYISSEGINVLFYLNASNSWDIDKDNITDWRWDLDGDGHFGKESREQKMNTTVYLGVGDHILGLMVGDGNKYSQKQDILIFIRTSQRKPDFTIDEISAVNIDELSSDIFKGDGAKITVYVRNIGDNESNETFDVNFEYKSVDTNGTFIAMGSVTVTDTIIVNGVKLVELIWNTGNESFNPGEYRFRATVDYSEKVKELRERNNVFTSKENVTLLKEVITGDACVLIEEIKLSKTFALVNEIVYINISLKNEGEGYARYVDIFYHINGEEQYFRTIYVIPAGGNESATFTFSEDTVGNYNLTFSVYDNQVQVDETEIAIQVKEYHEIDSISPNPAIATDIIHFSGHIIDNATIIQYVWRSSLDDELYKGTNSSFTYTGLSNGTHIIFLKIQHMNGVWSNEVNTTLTIHGKPVAKIIEISPNPVTEGQTITLNGNGTDDGTIEWYCWRTDETVLYNGTNSSFTISTLSVGNHTIYFKVQDNYGVWSDEVIMEIKVENKDDDDDGGFIPGFGAALLITVIIISLEISHIKKWRRYGEN
ncbi:MAG: hypothetical protein KAU14_09250 [Thermoplasmata archaeon]|nr:hypothetical protein [Thermoplasmata archaeon]